MERSSPDFPGFTGQLPINCSAPVAEIFAVTVTMTLPQLQSEKSFILLLDTHTPWLLLFTPLYS